MQIVPNGRGRIDVHHHFCPPPYTAHVEQTVRLPDIVRDWTPERSLEDMDRGGVDFAVLSVTTPGVWFGDAAAARALARNCNEYGASLARENRNRFGAFAALPLPDVTGSLREVAYALDTLHLMGVGMYTSYGRRWLGDPLFTPLFEELDRRNAIVFVHPTLNECCADLLPDVSESIIEYGTDTTRTIASLVFSGAASRYPGVRFIFSHGGGTFPFLIERFEGLAKRAPIAARLPHGLRHELTRFHYDTAQASNPAAMSALKHVVPSSQILFGTDYPYRRASEYLGALEACGFSAGEIDAIHRQNAERLMLGASE